MLEKASSEDLDSLRRTLHNEKKYSIKKEPSCRNKTPLDPPGGGEEEEEEEEDNNNNNNNNNNDGERREHVVERVYEESGVG